MGRATENFITENLVILSVPWHGTAHKGFSNSVCPMTWDEPQRSQKFCPSHDMGQAKNLRYSVCLMTWIGHKELCVQRHGTGHKELCNFLLSRDKDMPQWIVWFRLSRDIGRATKELWLCWVGNTGDNSILVRHVITVTNPSCCINNLSHDAVEGCEVSNMEDMLRSPCYALELRKVDCVRDPQCKHGDVVAECVSPVRHCQIPVYRGGAVGDNDADVWRPRTVPCLRSEHDLAHEPDATGSVRGRI